MVIFSAMKRLSKIGLLISAVFLAVFILSGCEKKSDVQNNEDKERNVASKTEAEASGTKIINYAPPQDLPKNIKDGDCWTSSLAAPYRQDAWRCMVGNMIYDPCFSLPQDGYVLCDYDPSTGNAGFQLKLDKPLPQPDSHQDLPLPANAPGWLVELQDGTFCSIVTEVPPPFTDNLTASYDCNPNPNKEDDIFLLGELQSGTVGTAEKAKLGKIKPDGSFTVDSSENVSIKTIWR